MSKVSIKTSIDRWRPRQLRHSLLVRVLHWTLVSGTLILYYTGIYIARPGAVPGLTMRSARRFHMVGQFLFLGSFLIRAVHVVITGKTREIIPDKKDLTALPRLLRYELFLTSKEPASAKYNALQKLLFTSWIPLFVMKGVTGATLYWPNRTTGLQKLFGGLGRVRRLHYLLSVAQGSTIMGHIYLAATSGLETLKSIFTGYKAVGKK